MITPADADRLIGEHLVCLPIESLPLVQCAGAILRENVYGERDQPPFDRVAMDGVALASEAVRAGRRRFVLQGMQRAGEPPHVLQSPDRAIEIMTGAMLPAGCDAVVPVEQIARDGDAVTIGDAVRVEPWTNVHRRGSDSRHGEHLLTAGIPLGPAEVAIAASAGMARIRVSAQPMIVVVSTGDELVEPGEPIAAHQIRRSNAYGIVAALRQHGFARVADDHIDDDAGELRERLRLHLDTHDALILSGGVSMGRYDLVPQALAELGVRQVFHRIAQKPGKPMWFGIAPNGTAVFALPGNPVSTLVCLTRYVIPGLRAAMGGVPAPVPRIALASGWEAKSALTTFVPIRIAGDDWGRVGAELRPTNGSGDFTSLAGTDGFVEIPPGPNSFPKGFVTRYFRW